MKKRTVLLCVGLLALNFAACGDDEGKETDVSSTGPSQVSVDPDDRDNKDDRDNNCGEAVKWTLENGVLTISGTGAMYDFEYGNVPWANQLDSITSVNVADGVTQIGQCAFADCDNLTSVTIPDSVTAIQSWAFADCSSLTSITIPSNVTVIAAYVFGKCGSLTDIYVADGNSAYCSLEGVLFSADQTLLHTYPVGRGGSYSIPVSVTGIGDGAFHGASNLTNVTIPDSVTSIGNWAFTECSSLTAITIPESVAVIGDVAFYGTGLERVSYKGTKAQWEAISIGENYNEILASVEITYESDDSSDPE